jgi:hypothetical protein
MDFFIELLLFFGGWAWVQIFFYILFFFFLNYYVVMSNVLLRYLSFWLPIRLYFNEAKKCLNGFFFALHLPCRVDFYHTRLLITDWALFIHSKKELNCVIQCGHVGVDVELMSSGFKLLIGYWRAIFVFDWMLCIWVYIGGFQISGNSIFRSSLHIRKAKCLNILSTVSSKKVM